MKKVIIIGAGAAGLTAGYELLSKSSDYDVTIVEESSSVGGMCARFDVNGKNLDFGGHLLISHNPQVKKIWNTLLPAQGVASFDDIKLDRYCKINNGGPNPAETDNVMLSREKVHRVLDDNRLLESPVRLNRGTIKTFGFGTSVKSGFSQIGNTVFKHKETSLENYYLNRYGKQLYSMFLENYTEKVWGRHPSKISSAVGPILENDTLATVVCCDKNLGRDLEKASPVYANRYYYPKKGISYLFEEMADRFIEKGGSIHRNCKVVGIVKEGKEIIGINCFADDERFFVPCDILISSMAVKDMINGMDDIPRNVHEVVHGLSYRGLITVGVEVACMRMKNDTEEKTINDMVPDSLIYINDPKTKLGRIQVYNNFSPYLTNDNNILLGLNYYCNEGDYYWNLNDIEWNKIVVNDLINAGVIYNADDIVNITKYSVPKAFPGYFDTYDRIDEVVDYLNSFDNLYCIGRNGQHRMSSVDEAMLTAIESVRVITNGIKDKKSIWDIADSNDELAGDKQLYNSALLTQEVEYRGNVPLQRNDNVPGEASDEKPRIKRMRRPMMTPIKKADPEEAGKLKEPIIIDDRIVIAARPNRTIPIDIPSEMEEITEESINAQIAASVVAEPVYAEPVNTFSEPVVNAYEEPVNNVYAESASNVYENPVTSTYEEPVINTYDEIVANTYEEPVANTYSEPAGIAYEEPAIDVYEEAEANVSYSEPVADDFEEQEPAYETVTEPVYEEAPIYEETKTLSYEAPVQEVAYEEDPESTNEEVNDDSLYSINREAASKSIVKSWSVVTSETKVAKDSDIVKPVSGFSTVSQFTDNTPEPIKIVKSGESDFSSVFTKANKFEDPKDINATDVKIEKNKYSSYKSFKKNPYDNFEDVANNYELPPIDDKPKAPTVVVKSEGTLIKSDNAVNSGFGNGFTGIKGTSQEKTENVTPSLVSSFKVNRPSDSTTNTTSTPSSNMVISNDYNSIFEIQENVSKSFRNRNNVVDDLSDLIIPDKKESEVLSLKDIKPDIAGYDPSIEEAEKYLYHSQEEAYLKTQPEYTELVIDEPVYTPVESIVGKVEPVIEEVVYEETTVNEAYVEPVYEEVIDEIPSQAEITNIESPKVEAPKVIEPKPQYAKKEIDTSIVFKNARVIKSTKITTDQPIIKTPISKPKEISSLESLMGNNSKVIAVIKNGEVVPVKKKVSDSEKKPRTKKVKEAAHEEIVDPPISVVLDAKEAAQMTEALEAPKKRGRKRKAASEEVVKSEEQK